MPTPGHVFQGLWVLNSGNTKPLKQRMWGNARGGNVYRGRTGVDGELRAALRAQRGELGEADVVANANAQSHFLDYFWGQTHAP